MNRSKSRFTAAPYLLWMIIFIIVPLFMIGVFAFTSTVVFDANGVEIDSETLTFIDSMGIDRESGEYIESDEEEGEEATEEVEASEEVETSEEVDEAYEEEEAVDLSEVAFPLTERTIFTFRNIFAVSDYIPVLFNSVWLAIIATAICLVLAYPLSFSISRMHYNRQQVMLMLVMLPMWMNFLLRT